MPEMDFSQYRQRISPYRRLFGRVAQVSFFVCLALGAVPLLASTDGYSWWWLSIRGILMLGALVAGSLWLFNVGAKHGEPDPG